MSLLRTAARTAVITSTATRVHQRTAARQQGRWAEPAAAPQPAQVVAPVPAQPTAGTSDLLDQLTRLGALRDQGVLTPEEFEIQKARVLRSG
jgi:hypothetical protein